MSGTLVQGDGTTTRQRARRRWVNWRGWLLAAVAVVLAALIITLLTLPKTTVTAPLDPGNPRAAGGQALAQVLQDHGVTVDPIRRVRDTTTLPQHSILLVVDPARLSRAAVDVLARTDADIVFVDPAGPALERLAPDLLRRPGLTSTRPVAASCTDPFAVRAARITGGGPQFRAVRAGTHVVTCFGGQYATTYGPRGQRVTVISSPAVLANETIRDHGNAALALGVLGKRDHLTWLMASDLDPGNAAEPSRRSLTPPWFGPAALLLGLATVLLMLASGRRLGRLVPEPLPVTVHAAETVHGRATLYRRVGAHDRALDTLRARALRQAARCLGLPADAAAPTIVAAWAVATGDDESQLTRLLTEPAPGLGAADLLRRVEGLDSHAHRLAAATGSHR